MYTTDIITAENSNFGALKKTHARAASHRGWNPPIILGPHSIVKRRTGVAPHEDQQQQVCGKAGTTASSRACEKSGPSLTHTRPDRSGIWPACRGAWLVRQPASNSSCSRTEPSLFCLIPLQIHRLLRSQSATLTSPTPGVYLAVRVDDAVARPSPGSQMLPRRLAARACRLGCGRGAEKEKSVKRRGKEKETREKRKFWPWGRRVEHAALASERGREGESCTELCATACCMSPRRAS